ncbi:UNVERIFIED_CONTAM: Pectinesterase inhibitor 10 [Sesamum calycinum]|uniref:Pectinesterase inhibitor 10 n=1 Tax=Sesamum calycinum TaxID=2727403 RepID=A0AAW2M1E3_9LAMI
MTVVKRSLANYATKIKTSPKLLATTALLVTFNATRSTSKRLRELSVNRALKLKPGEIQALLECVEEVNDSVYELRKSIKELNDSRKGPEFELRMSDVQTWVSAALTDDDTCMDDFTTRGRVRVLVRRLVVRIARLTSIALAFINNYAAV